MIFRGGSSFLFSNSFHCLNFYLVIKEYIREKRIVILQLMKTMLQKVAEPNAHFLQKIEESLASQSTLPHHIGDRFQSGCLSHGILA